MANDSETSYVKEAIMKESTRLFLANGFRGTSVKEITQAAGIGRGTLYWYFKSKEEILESIFRKFESEFVEGIMEAVRNCDGDFVAKYRAFHKFATEFARDNRDLALGFNTLLNEIVGSNTESERLAKDMWERFRSFVEGMLEDGKREGTVAAGIDAAIYAHIVVASHTGMLVQWFVNGESLDVRSFVRTFRKFLLKGLTGRER
ncbi:MAG: TetR/AcrR family transcriptional regulator [Desulfomonile tiedjei]|nr:TetR/AcrR family transcriptional regulator [Desulfomonile tiedjei]